MWQSKTPSRNTWKRFHANVEGPLRLSGWSYGQNFDFTQSWRYNTKLHEPNEENGTPLFWVELTFKGYEDTMIFCVSIFIFRLEPTLRQQLDENNLRRCYGIFFESTILKLLDQATFKVLSQQLQDTLTTAIWSDTLQLKILQTWITIWTNFFLSKYL